MKKLFTILIALLIANTVFAEGKMSFSNGKISAEIPVGWQVLYAESPVMYYIFSPEKAGDTFRENITITEEKLPAGIKYTAEKYMEASSASLKSVYSDIEFLETGKDWIIYNIEINGFKVRQYGKAIVKKDTAYYICAAADMEDFDSYLEIFKAIFSSVK